MDKIEEYNWSSEEAQKIIKEVSDRIRESKYKGHLVDDKRFEELKERMKALLKKGNIDWS